ncbi:Mur ligase family protein, partial [Clostridium saudiense]
HIPGLYNIYNALGVIGMLVVGGYVSVEDVIEAFDTMKAVAGRCERVYHDKMKCTVVVDYAHTPDGLENILETMKEVVKGKLITVFGCGGDRDKTKRPLMGEIAEKYSDVTIVTSDNPRTEDPHSIIEDILAGIKDSHTVIEDRKEAIEYACRIAGKDDIVVIAGKGHEDYQIIGTVKRHFSDKEVVINYFNEI